MYYSINTKVALFIVFFCFWVATHLCLFACMDMDIGIYELTDTVICDFQSFNQIFQRPFMVPKLPWPTSHLGLSAVLLFFSVTICRLSQLFLHFMPSIKFISEPKPTSFSFVDKAIECWVQSPGLVSKLYSWLTCCENFKNLSHLLFAYKIISNNLIKMFFF